MHSACGGGLATSRIKGLVEQRRDLVDGPNVIADTGSHGGRGVLAERAVLRAGDKSLRIETPRDGPRVDTAWGGAAIE